MTFVALHGELKTMLSTFLEIDDFGDDEHFVRDLRADSMLMEAVVANIEKQYGIQLPNQMLRNVRCLNDLLLVVGGIMGLANDEA